MENILLIGGAGYIGSHTAKWLARRGLRPVTFDNLCRGHREAVQWGPLEQGDIGDKERVMAVIRQYRPVAAIHFAAFAYVGESMTNPAQYYKNNVADTLVLLDAMLECNLKRIVFSSTCATYGIPDAVPIHENEPQKPINPYGRTKWMVEQILEDYDRAYGLKSVCLRYFNAAGADPDLETGEHHDPETHLIPLILDVAAGRSPHVTVFGDDYPTPDGTCIRDYIHVMDLAQAHHLALGHLAAEGTSQRLNLGNGNGYSVNQVIASARKLTGHAIPVQYGPRRPGDPPRLVGSAKAARDLLGWSPQYADIDAIVDTAWNWHRKLHGLKD